MGLFTRNKRQSAIDEMEQDLIATEEVADFQIETQMQEPTMPSMNFQEIAPEPAVAAAPQVSQAQEVHTSTDSKESQNWLTDYEGEGQLTIDVYQTDDDIVIKSTIAGVSPEDLDVSINADMLTIRGTRKKGEIIPEENYFYQECYWGTFSRSIILPTEVRAEKIDASLKDGILTVTLPKAQKDKTRKILVKSAK